MAKQKREKERIEEAAQRYRFVTGPWQGSTGATVLTENGFLLKECEHGIRHPVGRFGGEFSETDIKDRHESVGPNLGWVRATCCCCYCPAPKEPTPDVPVVVGVTVQ